MNPINGLLIVTLILLLCMLVLAVHHLWEVSELRYDWERYKKNRVWSDTYSFIRKIKEVEYNGKKK